MKPESRVALPNRKLWCKYGAIGVDSKDSMDGMDDFLP